MPLPTPNAGESQDDFISRCMGNPTAMDDFPDRDQRLAVCFSQWRAEHGGEPPKAVKMERKALQVEIKDNEKGIVHAVIARMEVKDHDGDWTLPDAFGRQDVRVSAYNHGSWAGELPVGKGSITEKDGEAIADLSFFMGTTDGREHFEVVKAMGELQEWSYGFDVVETGELTDELEQKGVRRVIKKVKVHEVSPVLLGAGIGTRTVAVKCADCEAREKAEAEATEQEAAEAAERAHEVEQAAIRKQKAQEERERLIRNIQKFGRRPKWD